MSIVPRVSIVIPVFNGEGFLQETVRSVTSQLFEDFELLIINDGSTDRTAEIARDLESNDGRILYHEKPNSGVSASRNFGLEKARGEFVVFLDADDLLSPDFLQLRVEFLHGHPQVGVCGSEVKMIDGQGRFKDEMAVLYAPGENMLEDILFYRQDTTTIPSNLMHRRSLLTHYRITFDPRLNSSADRLFLCKLAGVTTAHCLSGGSLYYRVHADSMYHDPKSKRAIFKDNELFIMILTEENIVPVNKRRLFFLKNYYMLAGAGRNAGYYSAALGYGMKYFLTKAKLLF